MKVMCLDPSMRNIGVAILKVDDKPLSWKPKKIIHHETIKTKKKRKLEDDYKQFIEVNKKLLKIKKRHNCKMVVAEIPHGARSHRASMSIGLCWGLCASLKAVYIQASVITVLVIDYPGKTKKEKAVRFVSKNLDKKASLWDVDEMEHVADAICAYYAYLEYLK